MFHSRKSRESRLVDSGALAAASAIGKALDANGTKVDAEKLPRYNSLSRSNSILRAGSMSSRSGSLRTNQNGMRLSSLQLNNNRNKYRDSVIDESEFFDAEDTFHAFGGAPAPTRQATVRKYVPGPNGLVAVEVPITESLQQRKRSSGSLRRSTSMNSGLHVRTNSLGHKSSSGSLASKTKKKPLQGRREATDATKRHTIDMQKNAKPLMEQLVKEETEEQLEEEKKDVVKPIVIPPSPGKEDPEANILKSQIDVIDKQRKVNELLEKAVDMEKKIIKEEQRSQGQQTAPTVLVFPPQEDSKQEILEVSTKTESVSKKSDASSTVKNVSEVTSAVSEDSTPVLETSDPVVVENGIKVENKYPSEETVAAVTEVARGEVAEMEAPKEKEDAADTRLNSGSSMAQYLRSANQYLSKGHEKVASNNTKEAPLENTVPTTPRTENTKRESVVKSTNLQKVPSPMKSALKKKPSRNSTGSHYEDRANSKANEAYLSLATAENTRLNAKLTSDPPSRKSSLRKTRPASMMTQNVTEDGAPGLSKTKHLSMQSSMQQVQPPARSKKRPEAGPVGAENRERKSGKSASQSKPSDRTFYPKEPPVKRSSFEKQRPPQSHLGFKKLSLREDATDAMYEQSTLNNKFHQNDPQTPTKKQEPAPQTSHQKLLSISGGAWKSRFQDSDSEEESAPFSSGGSGSTQPSSTGGNLLFKNKNDSKLAPPQPQFSQPSSSAPTSKHSTPNKKISQMSLRTSSSVSELGPTKVSNNMTGRFYSEALPTVKPISEPKKKNGFGKKLKKIFGRKK